MSKYQEAVEEFLGKYERPTIEDVTVGFSGIDPQRKYVDIGVEDHELLEGLLGGDNNGHYHLTQSELDKLNDMPATISIGTVTTAPAGSQASVTQSGTGSNAVLNFIIPKGDNGEQGAQGIQGIKGVDGARGADGRAATISIGSVSTGAAGSSASVTNSGTVNAAILNFTIPRGATGADGARGADGAKGQDGVTPTISIGSVATGAAGSSAIVTKSGTASNVVLNFTIPKGDKGDGADITVYDRLDAPAYNPKTALSAYQGKILNDKINAIIADAITVYNGLDKTAYQAKVALSAYQGKILLDKINAVEAKIPTVLNSLASTSTTAALSAYQGKVLNDKIIALGNDAVTVYNGLDKTAYNSKVALSAYQGKVLNDKINALNSNIPSIINGLASTSTTAALSAYQGKVLNDKINSVSGNIPTVYNGLNKTAYEASVALSAYQGKVLDDKIKALDAKIKTMTPTTETWQFTLTNGTKVTKKVVLQ